MCLQQNLNVRWTQMFSRWRFCLVLLATCFVSGCHRYTYGSPLGTTDGLRYSAAAAVTGSTGDTMRIAVVVANESGENRFLNFPNCFTGLSAVSAKVRLQAKEWSSEVWEKRKYPDYYDAAGRELPRVCAASLMQMILRPGATYTYFLTVPVSEILADSLQTGRYKVFVQLRLNGVVIRRRTPDLEL
jgi:hypothetical protein